MLLLAFTLTAGERVGSVNDVVRPRAVRACVVAVRSSLMSTAFTRPVTAFV